MSPFSGEHSCRLAPPGDYREFARKNAEQESEGKKIDVVYGIRQKAGKRISEIQSLRYKTEDWTEDKARSHCEGRKGVFEPKITLEPKLKEARKFAFAWPLGDIRLTKEHLINIQLLKTGTWAHKDAPNGKLTITRDLLGEFVENFEDSVVGEVPIDIGHHPKEGHAVGWLKKLWQKFNELWCTIDITDEKAQENLKNGSLKYISAQIFTNWPDPSSGKLYNIIRSAGLTNYPLIKNLHPAVVNFSDLEIVEEIEGRKKESLLLTKNKEIVGKDKEIVELKETGKTIALELIRANKRVDLKDRVIIKLQIDTRIDLLAETGALSPFEAQECRKLAFSDIKSVDLAIKLLGGRGKAWTPGQESILTPRKGTSRLGLTELQQAVDKEKDPERHSRLLELLDNRIVDMKIKRGVK